MSRWLTAKMHQKLTREFLLQFATKIALKLKRKINGDAKRPKDSLICWICENAQQVLAAKPAIIAALRPENQIQPSNGGSHEWDSTDGFASGDFGDDQLC
jgi:hypothetical protein